MRFRTYLRPLAAVLPLLAIAAGARGATAPPAFTASDRADVAAFTRSVPNGVVTTMDMANPLHYRSFRRALRMAGITAETSPQLYRRIEQARTRAVRTGHVEMLTTPTPANAETGPQPLNFIADLSTNDQWHFNTTALSSIPGGTTATVLTIGLYDASSNPLGPVGQVSTYNAGTDATVQTSGQLAAQPPGPTPVTAQYQFFYEDKAGRPNYGQQTITSTFYPTKITCTAPNTTNATPIKVCLNRNNVVGDCTYDCSQAINCNQTTPSNTAVVFPVAGSVTYNANIDAITFNAQGQPTNAINIMTVAFVQTGGGCTQNSPVNFFKDPNTKVTGNTLSWSMNPATFGQACYQANSNATFAWSTYVSISGNVVWAFINNTGTTPTQSTLPIPAMTIVLGCLAEGTKVTMADGSLRRIETFDARERILAGPDRRILTVEDVVRGTEEKPLVRITTAAGQSLLLTEGHPVVTSEGVRIARRLKAGDRVITPKGQTAITDIRRERYTGAVWNLNVGLPGEDANFTATHDNTTFFANGILVGDGRMQAHWEREDRRDRRNVLEALPKAWHQDYLNSIAAKQQ